MIRPYGASGNYNFVTKPKRLLGLLRRTLGVEKRERCFI